MSKKLAIIGAGISGLVINDVLRDNLDITIFEKSKRVAGRMSTRVSGEYAFDHGAQCFTIRTAKIQSYFEKFIENNIVSEWKGRVINLKKNGNISDRVWKETHLVGSPSMSSICSFLAKNANISLNTKISEVNRVKDKWILKDDNNEILGEFDYIISTAPPAQTIDLLDDYLDKSSPLCNTPMQSSYALMIGIDKEWDRDFIAAKIHENFVKWISIDSTKPGRNKNKTCIVAHTKSNWANENIDKNLEEVKEKLLLEVVELLKIDNKDIDFLALHKWLYAIVGMSHKKGPYYDPVINLGATSDWTKTSRIEEVVQSALEISRNILSSI